MADRWVWDGLAYQVLESLESLESADYQLDRVQDLGRRWRWECGQAPESHSHVVCGLVVFGKSDRQR